MLSKENLMIKIKFLDGNVKEFSAGVTGAEIAASISKSLEKKALAVKVDGKQLDLNIPINADAEVEIITSDTEDGLEIIRHDAAHILAEAVKELFPETQVTIGPTIENGFYYDFAREEPFTEADLGKIESMMKKIIARNEKIERKVISRDEAVERFEKMGEHYKVEIIKDLPADEEISIYSQGEFADLCRGPHSPSTGKVKAVKLMKVAGAYWRGDSNNEMLQRIYGTAWASEEQLKDYIYQLEEAEKRDHRKLGKELEWFHFQEEAPGAVFWQPKGWAVFLRMIEYMRTKNDRAGYLEISTPELLDRSLWELSGHYEKFGENMFFSNVEDEKRTFAVKPMNCPGGVQVYKKGLKSYKDLPLKLSEFGKVHRYEPSGALHGLMRCRAFTQDDAHVFCTEDQIAEESKKICDMVLEIYKAFGFGKVHVKFSDRPEKRIGSDEIWDKSEEALRNAADYAGLTCTLNKGEGAFYGPKLEFVLKDAIGRDWQLGTLQVDLNLAGRLGATYVDENGDRKTPVMLHRALFGSLERFMGVMIEHYAGKLPLWLAPVHVVVASITNDIDDYAKKVHESLMARGIRSELDLNADKIGYKVRKHSLLKVPYIVAVGRAEMEKNEVSIRELGVQGQQSLALTDFVDKLEKETEMPL